MFRSSELLKVCYRLSVDVLISACFRLPQDTCLNFLDVPPNELAIESVQDIGPSFRLYLQQRRFKLNAVRSYSNFAAMLLRKAKELGWTPQRTEVSDSWLPIASALPRGTHCGTIVRYAIRHQIATSHFSDEHLRLWSDELLKWGRSYDYVRNLKGKRLTNTPVRQAESVLKYPDDRKNRVVSVQATYPCRV